MLSTKTLYSLNDITIIPITKSYIKSRNECNIFKNNYLPLFTAPMSNVINKETLDIYCKNKIIPILPRTESLEDRLNLCKNYWCAFSLSEFEKYFSSSHHDDTKYVLIDVANGHMNHYMELVKKCKSINPNIKLMVGNVANPETFSEWCKIGVDFVRLSIGSGTVCTTASNTAIYYPMASLIYDCFCEKIKYNYDTKIIADGGFKNYNDIIKAYALGADYVMCGSIFSKSYDAPGTLYLDENLNKSLEEYEVESCAKYKIPLYKEYFGMSTKKAQKLMNKNNLHTSEGKTIIQKVEYSLSDWVENFSDYLKSAMSYCGIFEINLFTPLMVVTSVISYNSSQSFNK